MTPSSSTDLQPLARPVAEERLADDLPLWRHPEWADAFPWLVQGTTGRGDGAPFDMGLFGPDVAHAVMRRWERLRRATGVRTVVHGRQVHGPEILAWDCDLPSGLVVSGPCDAHLVSRPELLLTVSVADCIPVSIVDADRHILVLAHAGWRGVAAGVVEQAFAALASTGARTADLWLHCGPAICGRCYEVGPEVHQALLPERAPPAVPTPIDLRRVVAARAAAAGVVPERMTVSTLCTRCGPDHFFSHRAGSPHRQLGILGRRE